MDKLDCIVEYFNSNESMFLLLYDIAYNEKIPLEIFGNTNYVKGAKVGAIASLLLNIREDMLEKHELNYESKIEMDKLIECVELIATKANKGYTIDNYLFKSANEVVSTIRNKLAHGDYTINFKDNRVILNIENNSVRINIDKLSIFIIRSLQSILLNDKNRRVMRIDNVVDRNPLKLKSEFRNVIKRFKSIVYNIESNSGVVPTYILEYFSKQMHLYRTGNDIYAIDKCINYLKSMGYRVNISIKHINNDLVDDVCEYLMKYTDIDKLNYRQQLQFIGPIVQRYIDKRFNKFNHKFANFKNLLFLDTIKKAGPNSTKQFINSVTNEYGDQEIGFDLLGISTINMFNVLFAYSFDDLYKNNNEYKNESNNGLDYSKLDLSKLNIILLNEDKNIIIEKELHKKSLEKEISIKDKTLSENRISLKKVEGKNTNATEIIKDIIVGIEKNKEDLGKELEKSIDTLNNYKLYYEENRLYFKNKAIIEGIRNSIAHGNYEIVCNREFDDAKLIFSDIYEGKLTFKAEIPIKEFGMLLGKNTGVIQEFIDSKKAKSKIR